MGVDIIERIKGIVLQPIKYSDSGIILRLFTREVGGMSVMVKGVRKRGSGKSSVYFQPLNILDMEVYIKATRGVQLMKECSPHFIPTTIRDRVGKSCVAMFLGEVLTALVRDGDPNPDMFDFIEDSIRLFDSTNSNYPNFHISFIAKLCGFMGIAPNCPTTDSYYFDMINGKFSVLPPPHNGYVDRDMSKYLAIFFFSSLQESESIAMSGAMRNSTLDTILKYISIHIPMSRQIKSLDVMRELFCG